MKRPTSVLGAACLALVACGGSGSSNGGSVSGTVHGSSISIADSVSAAVTATISGTVVHGAYILLASTANTCADVGSDQAHPNEKGLGIILFDVNGTTYTAPTAPGTYSVYQGTGTPPPKVATLNVYVLDATCKDITASEAKGMTGTVTLTTVSGNLYSGNYDVALDSGDHITGSFDPEECPGLMNFVGSSTPPTCI